MMITRESKHALFPVNYQPDPAPRPPLCANVVISPILAVPVIPLVRVIRIDEQGVLPFILDYTQTRDRPQSRYSRQHFFRE